MQFIRPFLLGFRAMEGQVTKTKLATCQMCGQTKYDLLRTRVLLAS